MPIIVRVLACVGWLALTVGHADATTVRLDDTRALMRGSHQVVVGRIVSLRPYWDPAHRRIFTDVRVRVLQTLKGPPADSLTLTQMGGELDGVRTEVEGSPAFTPGDEALLFVWRDRRGRCQVNGLSQGRFGIVTEATTGIRRLDRQLPGVSLRSAAARGAKPGAGGRGPALDEALSTLRGMAAADSAAR